MKNQKVYSHFRKNQKNLPWFLIKVFKIKYISKNFCSKVFQPPEKEPEQVEKTKPVEPEKPAVVSTKPTPAQAPVQSPVKKKTEKSAKKVSESPRKNSEPKKDAEVKLGFNLEKESDKPDKRSERKRKREKKEEVMLHGPPTTVVATAKTDKKVDSLSQIISESDSEGKESTKHAPDIDYIIGMV